MSVFSKRTVNQVFIITFLLMVAGCSLKPIPNTPEQTYVLNPPLPVISTAIRSTPLTLLVDVPKATQAFDTTQMAYIDKPYQLSYFSYNQWADTPAQMLYPLLIQALQNSGHFRAVITNNGTQHDLVLTTHLFELQQSFLQHPSQIQLSVQVQLINNATHQVIATEQFVITRLTTTDTPYGGVIAANQVTAKLLQQITEFCLVNSQPLLKHK